MQAGVSFCGILSGGSPHVGQSKDSMGSPAATRFCREVRPGVYLKHPVLVWAWGMVVAVTRVERLQCGNLLQRLNCKSA